MPELCGQAEHRAQVREEDESGKPFHDVPDNEPALHRRRSDALANVARIVDTAAELLSRDPHVSIGEIAHRAGVGRSTLYRHFATRETLV